MQENGQTLEVCPKTSSYKFLFCIAAGQLTTSDLKVESRFPLAQRDRQGPSEKTLTWDDLLHLMRRILHCPHLQQGCQGDHTYSQE